MNRYKFSLIATAVLLASASFSRANVVTATASHGALTDWGVSTPTIGYTPTFDLPVAGFNTALGTLTGVVVTLTSSVTGSIALKNNGATTTNVSALLTDVNENVLPGSVTKNVTLTLGPFTNSKLGARASTGPHAVSGSTTTVTTYSAGLNVFDSTWDIVTGDFGSLSVNPGNGDGTATYSDTGSVLVSAAYTFMPSSTASLPEPTAMALLGSALAGLGLLRLRRLKL